MNNEELKQLSEMYAFVGNSLLAPMNQTPDVGLTPEFWASVSDFGDEAVVAALDDLCDFAQAAQDAKEQGEDPVTEAAYEHTKLFMGPPSPAAAPWETYYPEIPENGEPIEVTCGFGMPTFKMRELLQELGLGVTNENHQYEDHIGIELLYISVLLNRAAEGEAEALSKAESFIEEHPAVWIGRLMDKVAETFPEGYIIKLLALAKALLNLPF